MLPCILWTFLLALGIKNTMASDNYTRNVLRTGIPLIEEDRTMSYVNYNESSIPLFSRDFEMLELIVGAIEDQACKRQSRVILNNLRNLTTWAAKFYDSSAKFPNNILAGSFYNMGNFDECLDINNDEERPGNVRAQYCLTEVHVKASDSLLKRRGSIWEIFKKSKERYKEQLTKLYWGVCVPAACSRKDIEDGLQRLSSLDFKDSPLTLTISVPEKSCRDGVPPSIDTNDIIYISIISAMFFIVLVGTIFHAVCLTREEEIPSDKWAQALIVFSLIKNLKRIFSPAQETALHINCIAGIKFISMLLIVASHYCLFIMAGPVVNVPYIQSMMELPQYAFISNNPLVVDTFLLLSAFLFCRILLEELDKKKTINLLFLYIIRYIRLTPAYFVVIGFYTTLITKLGSGPLWSKVELEKERCLASWWTNLLYINNYYLTDKLCMFQSWFLSVDTQLFVLASCLVYPLWKWQRYGRYILVGITTVSLVIPFAVTLINQQDPTLMFYYPEYNDITRNSYFNSYYIKTHMRAAAYCLGLIFGYIAYRIQAEEKRLSKKTVRLGWIIGALSMISSMYSIVVFYTSRRDFSSIEAAIYATFHRTFWCIGTGWIIIACITDNSGVVKKFLNWRYFVPFSRLTYCMYLVNGIVELHSLGSLKSPRFLSTYGIFLISISHIIITILGAIILTVSFESPIIGLERLFIRKVLEKKIAKKNGTEGNCSSP